MDLDRDRHVAAVLNGQALELAAPFVHWCSTVSRSTLSDRQKAT